jgi:hypothetical protein
VKLYLLALTTLAIPPFPAAAQSSSDESFLDGVFPLPDAQQWTPVTQRDRFDYYFKNTFSLSTLAGAAISGGYRQYRNDPVEWHQGAGGYGRRVGDSLAKSGVRLTVRYAMAAALREDNRYIAAPSTTRRGRLWYAITQTYATHDARGHRRFSFSKVTGNAGGAAISQAWAPHSWRNGRQFGQDFALITLVHAGLNVATEFGPDLLRRIKH